jgi:hypothetical protein
MLPRSQGGQTEMANVALACPHCNAHKWAHLDEEDPVSGQRVALFNPRIQQWEEHLQWSVPHPFDIVGISAHRRATVTWLQMNHPDPISIRHLLAALGIS